MNETILTVRGVTSAVWRHKGKSTVLFVSVMGLVLTALMYLPRQYRSEAKLFVRLGRESVTLDPTATTGQTVSVQDSRQNEINSVLEMLRSRAMAEKVVAELGAERILNPSTPVEETEDRSGRSLASMLSGLKQRLFRPLPISEAERATDKLQDSMQIEAARDSNVISITCRAATPELARQIVDRWLAIYRQEHIRVNRTDGSFHFFREQSELLGRQWERASERLREAKNELGIVSVEGKRQLLQSQVGMLENQILQAQTSLATSRAKIARLEAMIAALPLRLVTSEQSGMPNVARDTMRHQLYTLEIREHELLAKYTEEHPEVIAVRNQVQQVRAILDEQPEDRTQTLQARNPNREALELNLLNEQAVESALEAQITSLSNQMHMAGEQLQRLNDQEALLAQLQRDVDLAASSHRAYAEKLEQARIDEALEHVGISNVNVVQPATLERRAVSPRKQVIVFLGLLLAVGLSLGTPLLLETLNHSMRTPEEVEERLQLPVLVSVPHTSRNPILLNGANSRHDSPISRS